MKKIGDVTATATAAGEFTEGNAGAGVPATLIKADWLNGLQRELLAVLAKANVAADPASDTQVADAIAKLISDAVAGAVAAASETVAGVAKIATDADFTAGTDDTKFGTVKKIKTWFGTVFKQATESVLGGAKVATAAQITSGTDDATIVTPKKLATVTSSIATSLDGKLGINKALDSTIDLNTLGAAASQGLYWAGSNVIATLALNYPVAGLAGRLLVMRNAYGCSQEFTSYNNRKFVRGLTGVFADNGPWTAWVEVTATATTEVAGRVELATAAETQALSDATRGVTPASMAKVSASAWVSFKGDGTVAIRDSHNVSSITDNGTGDYTVNFATAMANANYGLGQMGYTETTSAAAALRFHPTVAPGTSSMRVLNGVGSGSIFDAVLASLVVFGGK